MINVSFFFTNITLIELKISNGLLQEKAFPNLATLMNYFMKSQEREIHMQPVYCKDQGRRTA